MAATRIALDDWIDKARYFQHEQHRIAYWTAGQGRPLLLIHGYPTSSWDWHKIWLPLSEQRQLIACDMLGFGLSDKPRSGYSIHAQTEVHINLLKQLGVDEYDAVAHDYGVSVGQELLALRNEQGPECGLGRILRITHTLMHYIADRVEHHERWVGALQNASVPVKLVDGGADPVSGRHMYDYFREMVPNAEAVCFDDIGHYPQTEAPERVLRELQAFF